MLNKKV